MTGVWRSANWYEREVFDLFGIRFLQPSRSDAHHDAGRLGRPSAAQGLSGDRVAVLGKAIWPRKEIIDDTLVEVERDTRPCGPRRMVLNMGPQHPSTHGVLRLLLELDGETITECQPDIGYLHTGIEKEFEVKTYQQGVTLTDRIDYLAPLSNNLGYCLAVEKLLGLEIPPQAQWMRVMLTELTRLNSHLVWLGTHAIDIGAMSVFLYCFREREDILRIFEMFSGQRMMTSYFRIGGLALEPPRGWQQRVKKFIDIFPSRVDEYEDLLTNNRIWIGRTKGVGYISLEDMLDLGVTGPMLRAAGLKIDARKDAPYSSYEKFDFEVPTRTENDVFARYQVRIEEMRQSAQDHQAGARRHARRARIRPMRRTWCCPTAKR